VAAARRPQPEFVFANLLLTKQEQKQLAESLLLHVNM